MKELGFADESKFELPLFNPPAIYESQLVTDFIFSLRVRFEHFYSMNAIEDNPYEDFQIQEFDSQEAALDYLY